MKLRDPILIQSKEIVAFNNYLKILGNILCGVNYVTYFEAKAFDLTSSFLEISKVMFIAYPHSKPNETYIKECSLEILLEVTDSCFSYCGASFVKDDANGAISEDLRTGFYRHLAKCVDYENAAIYSYNSEVGLPGYDVFWSFCWLIHNVEQGRCVLLYGGSSD